MGKSRIRYSAAIAAIAIAGSSVVMSSTASAVAAPPTSTPSFRIVGTTPGYLTSLVAPSLTTQWAFGSAELSKPAPPVVLQHTGNLWVQATMPNAANGGIVCAGASSPSNVWAFESLMYGPFGANTAAALHLSSGHWVIGHNFGSGLFVTGCNVLSSTNVWAFGSTGAGPSIGTWHLQGSTWARTTSYPAASLGQASVVSPSNIWATGWDGVEGLLAHWNGSSWAADPSLLKALPKPSSSVNVQVQAVTAVSSANLWVEANVGRMDTHGTWHYAPQVEHWNGVNWSQVMASAFGYYLPVAVPDTHGGWWTAGYQASPPTSMTFLLHGSNGLWVKVPLPAARAGDRLEVTDVVNVPGTRVAFAVADEISVTTGHGTGVILKVTY